MNDVLKNEESNAMFLHCLVCCTSLEKINNEICGEALDKEILEKMKWDINSIEIRDEIYENPLYNNKEDINKILNKISKH